MPNNERLSSILSGVAGQFFVAAEVSRQGYIATLTLRNTRGVDMLVASADASKSVGIQVKTNQGSNKVWLLDKKIEDSGSDNLIYVFVNLNGSGTPTFHVVRSQVVAEYARKRHLDWLSGIPRRGLVRKDNPMRKFEDPRDEHLNAWHCLFNAPRRGKFSK